MPKVSSGSVKVFYPAHSRSELIEHMRGRLPILAAALPVQRFVLFGSWAKGRATAFSDVDILVIYSDPPRDDAYQIVWRCLQVRGLEPHVYSESQASAIRSTLERMTVESVDLMVG